MAEGNSKPDYLKIIADHRKELLMAMQTTDWAETKNKVFKACMVMCGTLPCVHGLFFGHVD